MKAIFETYRQQREVTSKGKLPTCMDYGCYLSKAMTKFSISINEARTRYGRHTYGQWKKLLGV